VVARICSRVTSHEPLSLHIHERLHIWESGETMISRSILVACRGRRRWRRHSWWRSVSTTQSASAISGWTSPCSPRVSTRIGHHHQHLHGDPQQNSYCYGASAMPDERRVDSESTTPRRWCWIWSRSRRQHKVRWATSTPLCVGSGRTTISCMCDDGSWVAEVRKAFNVPWLDGAEWWRSVERIEWALTSG
jgi:hypothetical protein